MINTGPMQKKNNSRKLETTYNTIYVEQSKKLLYLLFRIATGVAIEEETTMCLNTSIIHKQ